MSDRLSLRFICVAILLAVCATLGAASGASAQDALTIPAGTDAWATPGDGSTHVTLDLPAGFFCEQGQAFKGTVILGGVPIATEPSGAFGNADTLVERTADAVLDGNGSASVPIVVRALHFRSNEVLKTDCGDFTADVQLASSQKATKMTITGDAEGGSFKADIGVRTAMIFRSTDGKITRTLTRNNVLTAENSSPWSAQSCDGAAHASGSVTVDTNGNGVIDARDARVAGSSAGFLPGYTPNCRPVVLCRGKQIDPALHSYGAAQAAIATTTTTTTALSSGNR
jgi:hypothetical protein